MAGGGDKHPETHTRGYCDYRLTVIVSYMLDGQQGGRAGTCKSGKVLQKEHNCLELFIYGDDKMVTKVIVH